MLVSIAIDPRNICANGMPGFQVLPGTGDKDLSPLRNNAEMCVPAARALGGPITDVLFDIPPHCTGIVIAPDYAKAPECYWPHALRQAYGILNWISRPISEDEESLGRFLGRKLKAGSKTVTFDRTHIALTGGSSGANIATFVVFSPLCEIGTSS